METLFQAIFGVLFMVFFFFGIILLAKAGVKFLEWLDK